MQYFSSLSDFFLIFAGALSFPPAELAMQTRTPVPSPFAPSRTRQRTPSWNNHAAPRLGMSELHRAGCIGSRQMRSCAGREHEVVRALCLYSTRDLGTRTPASVRFFHLSSSRRSTRISTVNRPRESRKHGRPARHTEMWLVNRSLPDTYAILERSRVSQSTSNGSEV